MPAADQHAVYVAVVIAILGFMIGFAKGGFGGLGALLTPILALVLPVALAAFVLSHLPACLRRRLHRNDPLLQGDNSQLQPQIVLQNSEEITVSGLRYGSVLENSSHPE